MIISYSALFNFLQQKLVPKSLKGIIQDCYNSFEDAIATAEELEDYHFLSVMKENVDLHESAYMFFWSYKHELPFILEKDKPVNIDVLTVLCFDLQPRFTVDEFIEFIENCADSQGIDPKPWVEYFISGVEKRTAMFRLEFEKIGRNEQCPCGSGKKHKYCCGAITA